jgi:hypothetical protein
MLSSGMTVKLIKIEKVNGYDRTWAYSRSVQEIWESVHYQFCYELMGDAVTLYKKKDDTYLQFATESDALLFTLSKDVGELEQWVSTHMQTYVPGWKK